MAAMWRNAAALAAAVLFLASADALGERRPSGERTTAAPTAPKFARAWLIEVDGVRKAGQQVDKRLPPASLTKMMSGLLIVEAAKIRKLDSPHLITPHAAAATGSRLGLRAGESLKADDLLTAMLVASSNDACRAIAEWHSGTEAAFVDTMNQRARQLGLTRTHFKNACGHDAPGHLSTASDLATLARAAMAEPEFARRAGLKATRILTLKTGNRSVRELEVSTHNHLIGRLDGAIGIKSGFTAKAGKCLVALAERNGHQVLLILLDAGDRWWDAHEAIDYALVRAPHLPR